MATGACAWTTFVTLGVSSALTRGAEGAPAPTPVARDDAEATADLGGCHEPGVVYVEPHSSGQPFDIEVIGATGHVYVTIAQGMAPATLVAAINAATRWTGVSAEVSANPARVAVRSVVVGLQGYVSVREYSTATPIIFAHATGGDALYEHTDYGCAFGIPACADSAVLYLQTGTYLVAQGAGTTTLFISSNGGLQSFAFASGTTQTNLIQAINTFESNLGLSAEQSVENPDRVALRSRLQHELAFVRVQQIGGTPPIVVSTPIRGTPGYELETVGESAMPGDTDCNEIINVDDLIRVLLEWGDCEDSQPSCAGDLTGDGQVAADDLVQVILRWSEE
jgi:hypothetical protein